MEKKFLEKATNIFDKNNLKAEQEKVKKEKTYMQR